MAKIKMTPDAILVVRFAETLSQPQFQRLLREMFDMGNRFQFWGHPIMLGLMKAHVYGSVYDAENSGWVPFSMEVTEKGLVMLMKPEHAARHFALLVERLGDCMAVGEWHSIIWDSRCGG